MMASVEKSAFPSCWMDSDDEERVETMEIQITAWRRTIRKKKRLVAVELGKTGFLRPIYFFALPSCNC